MKKEFFSVEIETDGILTVLKFTDKKKAEEFGKPKSFKVEESVFNAMLENGDFEDKIPDATIVNDNQGTTEPQPPATEQQEEFRTMLENLKAQVEALQQENARLKIRPSFADMLLINDRRERLQKHILRFGEGHVKLTAIKDELHNYNELDETEFITLLFIKTNRASGEMKEMCKISNVLTLNALTTEALKQIDQRVKALQEEKEELESHL